MKKMFWLDAKPSIGARLCARLVDYSLLYPYHVGSFRVFVHF